MGITYPAPPPTVSGDNITINRFLANPTLIARRIADLALNRYIADTLLTGRYVVSGGAVLVEGEETQFADRNPQEVSPGGEYPLTTLSTGPATLVRTAKWGEDAEITDESIARQGIDPVNRALTKLVNTNVRTVDSVALGVIASRVTATQAAAAPWATATAKQLFLDVVTAQARIRDLNLGYEADTVVVSDTAFALAMATFLDAGYLPRESANGTVVTAQFPVIAGLRWLPTPNLPTGANTAFVVDSTQLGGMADENLGGPGYVRAGNGSSVEVKTIRDDRNDQYRVRARRVTVPVVASPGAARVITGVGA
ncbi:phage major capsid protein [Kineococcus terrestris]|uniref:phage major capsid protein n=1 Tax=Kineococcus terrestris TaxID=2044856 RepID=UPI0034DB1062